MKDESKRHPPLFRSRGSDEPEEKSLVSQLADEQEIGEEVETKVELFPAIPSSKPTAPVRIGTGDLEPFPVNPTSHSRDINESGMVIGPDHPIFGPRRPNSSERPSSIQHDPRFLPAGAIPPGAKFDPIYPIAPRTRVDDFNKSFPSGDPDPDEMKPPGDEMEYLNLSPRLFGPGDKKFPGPGGPPFF